MDRISQLILIFLTLSILYRLFPPKSINIIYGYRTKKSMKTQDIWDESNRFCANMLILMYSISLAAALLSQFVFDFKEGIRYAGISSFVGLFACILITEIHLWKNFDKDGKRK